MQKDLNFSKILINWYLKYKRDLPWRHTTDPYFIWLSEIMLQQTQVAQGLPYYLKFTETYPTVFHLAKASQEEVLKNWQGLGYYSRARNLHYTAKYISKELNGIFPNIYNDIINRINYFNILSNSSSECSGSTIETNSTLVNWC